MGDPRRLSNKFSGPRHPWQRERMAQERALVVDYGLKTKRELWKMASKVKSFANQAKRLIALRTTQSETEGKQLIGKLSRYGLLSANATLNDVLSVDVRQLLDRRLQTVLVKKGLARTPSQSRQFIVHGHVLVNGKKVGSPSHLVTVEDEPHITFIEKSSLANPEHPERSVQKPKAKKPEVEA